MLCMKCLSISGTAERIRAKFTWKTCLVPRSDEFECQVKGQRSRSPGRDKFPLHWKCIVTRSLKITSCSRRDHSIATGRGEWLGVHRQRRRSVTYVAACVRFMFGKTSLACSYLNVFTSIWQTATRSSASAITASQLYTNWNNYIITQSQRHRRHKPFAAPTSAEKALHFLSVH